MFTLRRRAAAAAARPSPESAGVGKIHSDALLEELKAERERRVSLEQRGLAVLSAAGVLIALLLNGAKLVNHSPAGTVALLAGLGSLLVAGAAGLVTAMPLAYGGLPDEDLTEILVEHWDEDDDLASRRVGGHRTGMILISRRKNMMKAYALRVAMIAAVAGVAASASAVAIITLAF